jgi:hypothetical protein
MNWQEFTALLALATAMSFSPGPNTTAGFRPCWRLTAWRMTGV